MKKTLNTHKLSKTYMKDIDTMFAKLIDGMVMDVGTTYFDYDFFCIVLSNNGNALFSLVDNRILRCDRKRVIKKFGNYHMEESEALMYIHDKIKERLNLNELTLEIVSFDDYTEY